MHKIKLTDVFNCTGRILLLLALIVAVNVDLYADTFTVTNTNGDDPGSLREAIEFANINVGPDTIVFNIPTSDPGFDGTVFTIQPLSALPALTDDGTFIDGSTQTVFTGDTNPAGPEIVINGSLIPGIEEVHGLVVESANNRIHSLVINGFPGPGGNGITIFGAGASGNVITGCFVGIDFTGTVAVPNAYNGISIAVGATNNIIGGATSEERNVISGNAIDGVKILDDGTSNNTVQGNFIGTDVTGTIAIPNIGAGVVIGAGILGTAINNVVGGSAPGEGNLISGNAFTGVLILGDGTSNNTVQGNFIGTDVTGTIAIPNIGAGVVIGTGILGTATNNVVGGSAPGEGNLISGNLSDGVSIHNSSGNVVLGNYIGTDITGTTAVGNLYGVVVSGPDNIIGGAEAGAGNLISGNEGEGVIIGSIEGTGNLVLGNYIGTDMSGTTALGNVGDGVRIEEGATGNSIGDGTVEGRNIISGNTTGVGVWIIDSGTSNNTVRGNFIGTDVTGTVAIPNNRGGVEIARRVHRTGGAPGIGRRVVHLGGDKPVIP